MAARLHRLCLTCFNEDDDKLRHGVDCKASELLPLVLAPAVHTQQDALLTLLDLAARRTVWDIRYISAGLFVQLTARVYY